MPRCGSATTSTSTQHASHWQEAAIRVHELIDILSDQPPDTEVEIAIVAPVDADKDDITVDRYFVDGVLPWQDAEDSDLPGELTIWLVGGEEPDVNAFLDAIEQPDA